MTTTLEQIPLRSIDPHPHNPRRELGDLTELAASIAQHGVLEPIVVVADGKRYLTIAGHRRSAAAAIAKAKTVPAIIREDLTDLGDQLAVMLVENLQRADLTPVEESAAYQELLALDGYTVEAIATMTGRSKRTVQLRLGLSRLPEKTLAKVQGRQISLAEAEVMATYAKDPAALKRLEAAAGTHSFTWAVEKEKSTAARKRVEAKMRTAATKAGYDRVLAAPPGYPWSGKIRPLRDLRIDVDAHADCPGRCAIIPAYGEEYQPGCADVYANGHKKEDKAPAAPKPESARQRAKRVEFEEGAAAAVAVRRAWLADQLAAANPPVKVLDALAAAALLDGDLRDLAYGGDETLERVTAVFGLKLPDKSEGVDRYVRAREALPMLIDQTRSWSASRVVAFMVYMSIEAAAPSDERYWRRSETSEVYELLAKAGYELSTWEQTALLEAAGV